jgi:hypothetical protein
MRVDRFYLSTILYYLSPVSEFVVFHLPEICSSISQTPADVEGSALRLKKKQKLNDKVWKDSAFYHLTFAFL